MTDLELKPQVYKDPRPQEYFDHYHERVRKGPPGWVYEACRMLVTPYVQIVFRARGIGSENVPNGPVILAPNHASFLDHFFAAAFLRRRVQFMGKSQLFKPGPAQWIFSHGGVFPVRRGYQDEDAFISAFAVLERGGAVVMYCEGGRSRTGRIAGEARPGIGRLALEADAPVVPVAILGSYQVRNWRRLQFPRVTVLFGAPFRFATVEESTREQQQEAAQYILDRIRALHEGLQRSGYKAAMRAARARQRVHT
jgi:1-acyl-sn-glycerol-3-phosphate acyltransferase